MTEKIPTGMVALGDWLGCCRWLVVLFICSVVSDCLQPHGLQHARLLCPSPSPRVCTNSCLLSRWCHPTISSSVTPLSSCPQSFPAPGSFPVSWLFESGAKVLELQLQHQSFQWIFSTDFLYNWLLWSPWCPRDSQESSPAPQFNSINSLVRSLLYGPTLKSVRDYWKNHTFNYMEDFPGGSNGKASVYNVGDPGSSPGSGRSPGEGNGSLLQYYCLENPMDRGAW